MAKNDAPKESKDIPNIFDNLHVYDSKQLRELSNQCDASGDTTLNKIVKELLEATIKFRSEYKPAESEENLLNAVTNIFVLLNNTKRRLEQSIMLTRSETTTSQIIKVAHQHEVLAAAIDYCANSVKDRVQTVDKKSSTLTAKISAMETELQKTTPDEEEEEFAKETSIETTLKSPPQNTSTTDDYDDDLAILATLLNETIESVNAIEN